MSDDKFDGRELGTRLQAARTERGLSQHLLAQQAGLRLDTLRSIEQNRTKNPGIFTVACLADVLGLTLDELAGREG